MRSAGPQEPYDPCRSFMGWSAMEAARREQGSKNTPSSDLASSFNSEVDDRNIINE